MNDKIIFKKDINVEEQASRDFAVHDSAKVFLYGSLK